MPMTLRIAKITHQFVTLGGIKIFYRDSGPKDGVPLLLLHGFPSASHQFRRLMDVLGSKFRLVAPDYPGFGFSDAPASRYEGGTCLYSFEALTDAIEGFCRAIGLSRFVPYMFDFGGPIGFRLASRHPDWIAGLIVQNANAYEQGLSAIARDFVALRREVPGDEEKVRNILTSDFTREQYVGGTERPELIAPEGWTLDQYFLDLPGRKQIQVDLAFDYKTNLTQYPRWQAWLRQHRPPTLITWGERDMFFTAEGARAYLNDVPRAELHLLPTGHFALEDHLDPIAHHIERFMQALR
jgi:pimeloyl-ACP methyl ester carboxylesterase